MRTRIVALGLIGLAVGMMACGGNRAPNTTQPTAAIATAVPATAQAAPTQAVATSAPAKVPTQAATQPAATAAPTSAPTASNTLPGGDLTGEQLYAIAKASFMHYPWRMRTSVTSKESKQTIEGLVEAQSGQRVHTVSTQPIEGQNVQIEVILIDPDLYGKATNAPAGILAAVGMKEGQWAKIPPNSPLQGYAQLARLAGNPLKILEQLGVSENLLQNKNPYKLVGSENLNGVQTNKYSWQSPSTVDPNQQVMYQVWIGTGDGLIHQMTSEGPLQTTKSTLEYDSSINIQPPL